MSSRLRRLENARRVRETRARKNRGPLEGDELKQTLERIQIDLRNMGIDIVDFGKFEEEDLERLPIPEAQELTKNALNVPLEGRRTSEEREEIERTRTYLNFLIAFGDVKVRGPGVERLGGLGKTPEEARQAYDEAPEWVHWPPESEEGKPPWRG